MCPACIGSALLLLTGATSTGGLALVASRALGARSSALPPTEDLEKLGYRSEPANEATTSTR